MNLIMERIAEWLYANPKSIGVVLFLVLATLRVWLRRSDENDDDEDQ